MKIKANYTAYFLGIGLLCLVACSPNRQADREFDEMQPPLATDSAPLPQLPKQAASGRIPVRPIGRLWEVFNDSNYQHYAHAERLGIRPITSLRDAYRTRRPVIKIESNELYLVDSLTHSLPYLVPEAARLLDDIARNFRDSLSSRGGYPHLFRVTSLLRTPLTVKKLRRINRNATDSSTHQFGTTFDISYARFYTPDSTKAINDGDLKNLLGEVLYDLRRQGRCLVKYERKSPCYHITVTR